MPKKTKHCPVKAFWGIGKDDDANTPVIINAQADNPYIREYGKPLVSAHRAGAGIVPENTLMAFDLCVTSEAFDIDLFELDVHLTRDGKLVVLHNGTLDATSNAVEHFGHKKVAPRDYTLEQLRVLNLGENFQTEGRFPYRGLRGDDIPDSLRIRSLDEILDYVNAKANKAYYYSIDVKDRGDRGRVAAAELYRVLGERAMYDRVIAASFNPSVSKFYDSDCPDMRRSASPPEVLKFYYYCRVNADLKAYDIRYSLLQIPYGAFKRPGGREIINLGTRQLINYAHKNNIAVQYWTINNKKDMLKLRDNGCDCIMTDYPDLAYEVIGK